MEAMTSAIRWPWATRLLMIAILSIPMVGIAVPKDVDLERSGFDGCTINGVSTGCVGQAMTFTRSCANTSTQQWFIDGVAQPSGTSVTYTFNQSGVHTVTLTYLLGGVTPSQTDLYVTIYAVPLAPTFELVNTDFCESASSVTLTLSNPEPAPVVYSWMTGSTYLGSGNTQTFTNLTATTVVSVWAASDSECGAGATKTINVYKTDFTPELDPSVTLYHKRILRGIGPPTASRSAHFWQTSATGTSYDHDLVTDYHATELGTYYIRQSNGSHFFSECWTNASAGVSVTTMNYTPPQPAVVVAQKYGYNEVIFLNDDKNHILSYANYYWVAGPSSTTILGDYAINGALKEWRKYANGTYYLRGRDKGTGTWGDAKEIIITLRDDNDLNWTQSKTYDGGATPVAVAESKSYFDDAGKALQSQTKNLEKGLVFASQGVFDKYNRVVGATLPAPVQSVDFLYNEGFFLNEDDNNYSYPDFDETSTRYNPKKAGDYQRGTVGWYYSDNNSIEPHVAKTDYPYSRTEFYEDGTGEVKRSAGPGDQHRLGSGHEVLTGTFPVANELDDYYLRKDTKVQFSNRSFTGGIMTPWQNFNPLGGSRQNFQWIYEGCANASSSGFSETSLLGQQRANGMKWPAGTYVIRVAATNQSTGGSSPLTSGLAVYASDTPASSATSISFTGDGAVNVGDIGKQLTVTFSLSQAYDFLLFTFYKYGPSSGYRVNISLSNIEVLSYNGIPQSADDTYSKGIQTVTRDENGKYGISITDKEGKTLLVARKGTSDVDNHMLLAYNVLTGNADPESPQYRPLLYFYILEDQAVTISQPAYPASSTRYGNAIAESSYDPSKTHYRSVNELRLLAGFSVTGGQTFRAEVVSDSVGWSVENMVTGERRPAYETFADANGIWPAGFYRVIINESGGEVSVAYKNYFQDVSYQFYDDMGRLKTSVSPNGYKKWIEQPNPATNFPIIDKTTYSYNFRGWPLSMTEPDVGTTTYKYRNDGKIRFSQNAEQAINPQRFSYTQYDDLGRPVESGEYKGSAYTYASVSPDASYSFAAGDIKDWVKIYYDVSYPPSQLISDTDLPNNGYYTQEFVRGAVSYSENENIKTWYSYDELGRVTWMAQKPKMLNRTFVSTYQYDFLGNVTRSGNLSYEDGVLKESFYHHYMYDKDKRLKQTFTSTDGAAKKLRATYDYYLHGPLKRVELGNGVQGIDFVYNINGWLTKINDPTLTAANDPGKDGAAGDHVNVRPDVFGMEIDYYESAMEDLFPTASVNIDPVTPERFHRLPESVDTSPTVQTASVEGLQLAMPSTQKEWTKQAKQVKEYLTARKQGRAVSPMPVPVDREPADKQLNTDEEGRAQADDMAPDSPVDKNTLTASVKPGAYVSPMPVGVVDDALEFAALKAIYDSLGGPSWTNKTGWPAPGSWPASATATQMDAWNGIVVTNGDITGIVLNSNNLTGKIPAAIANLSALTSLNFRTNNLNNKIPVAVTTLTSLQTLDLYQNQLTGGIPAQIGNMTSLVTLRLYDNFTLGGSIPSSIGSLTNLQTLHIRSCGLTGSIPPSLKKLHNLIALDISGNAGITGTYPPLGQLQNLQALTANGLTGLTTGPIPAWIDSLHSLVTLILDNSKRNGTIPTSIGTLTNLRTLSLRLNQLTGSIPAQITNLTELRSLLLNNNQLTGTIPTDIGNLTYLQTCYLYVNQLTGTIPYSFYNLTALQNVQLYGNQLSGVIQPEIGNLTAITSLDIHSNSFTGSIPGSIGNLTNLVILDIQSNQFNGELPVSLKFLTKLTTLYVNNNQLTGNVPDLGTLINVEYLQLHNNQFTGAIGSWIGSMNKLRTFRIDNNQFTAVHNSLMTSPQLTNVYLTSNKLTSVPNFFTYSNKANLNLYMAYNLLDFAALEPLFGTGTHGIKTFTYGPQNKLNDKAKIHVPAGQTLTINARPKGSYSTVTWEKQNGASWINVNSSNGDATLQTYQVANATSAVDGTYRWRMTNTRVTGLTLECDPVTISAVDAIAVNAGSPALYNGIITSSRWQTKAPVTESSDPIKGMYLYKYDDKYQVTEANWAEPNYLLNTFTLADNKYRVTNLAYDPNGNIKTLARYDDAALRTNNFTYAYEANKNKLTSVSGHVNNYTYNALGQMTGEDKVTGDDQYVEYDVSGKVRKVFSDVAKTQLKVEYLYDDRGFRIAKVNTQTNRTTWYIRDASGNTTSVYEQDGVPASNNANPLTQTEVPVYGAGKLGIFYPAQDGSMNYEITDHLGNVRALVRDNVNVYTATMEDDGTASITNPRVQEGAYFQNLDETAHEDYRFNHTPNGEYSAYLNWMNGSSNQYKAVGPAMTLKVSAGDTVQAEAWVRYENKLSYTRNVNIAAVAALLSGRFSFASGFENYTLPQTTTAFSNAMTSAGFMGDGLENEKPFAYMNYILFNNSMVMVDAGWQRVDESAGFDPGEEGLANQHVRVALENIQVPVDGYVYVWVSNESEGTKVWFDDIKITHTEVMVTQASDYGVWGDVLRELKSPDFTYRHGYQGSFSEKDQETGWNHFELREYDPVIGRWSTTDPKRQYFSPFLSNGNNPVNRVDPDGGNDGLFGRLLTAFKNWWNSALYSPSDDDPVPTEPEDHPQLIKRQIALSEKASKIEVVAIANESTPYVSMAVGKQTLETVNVVLPLIGQRKIPVPVSGNATLTWTKYGVYLSLGGDVTYSTDNGGLPSMSVSAGYMFAPSNLRYQIPGASFGGTAGGGYYGVEFQRSFDVSSREWGNSYQLGVVLSTSRGWGGVMGQWTVPIYTVQDPLTGQGGWFSD